MTPSMNVSGNLFVANLQSASLEKLLEKLIERKLELFFEQKEVSQVDVTGLYSFMMDRVEKVVIEAALKSCHGNQSRASQILGINRNTLKKKITDYRIPYRNFN